MAEQRLSLLSRQLSKQNYTTVQSGAKYTNDFKAYCKLPNGEIGSFFHDIPINLNPEKKTVNVLIEIPRWSNAKFEINKDIPFNPITQDTKKGKLRFVKNIFPYKGYMHNYGAIPQTWDDPTVTDKDTGFKGDNDPIDICEIGSKVANLGDVFEAKVLGCLALIDDGELDWKVIAINTEDELASELNDIDDVKEKCPGLLEGTFKWFRDYKAPDGKPTNEFGFNGKFLNSEKAVEVIQESHKSWDKLIKGNAELDKMPLLQNATLTGTPGHAPQPLSEIVQGSALPDAQIPSSVDKSYFV